jgi:hypothetical protein|tara:strand:+ start:385 stop:1041 length:657 start_codon:yes stop_codon:yes gene_type:complete
MTKTVYNALGFLLVIIIFLSLEAHSDSTNSGANTINQTSTSGSQTSISGGYSAETTNTYQSGSSSNTTTNNNTNNNSETAVNSANPPSAQVYSTDCVIPLSMGVTTIGLSIAGSNYYIDETCMRIKKSQQLASLGLKVSSISILCLHDPEIFYSLESSSTPCPVLHHETKESLIGKKAQAYWDKYPQLRPDYQDWKKRNAILNVKITGGKRSMTWNEN